MTEQLTTPRGVHSLARPMMYAALAAALVAMLALAAIASGHQTTTSRGVAVTLHVNPNDEPVAGEGTTIRIVRIRTPSGGKFGFGSCGCRLKIATAAGTVVFNGRAARITNVTFPDPTAYQITYSGSYRSKTNRKKTFSAKFAVRAVTS